MRALRTISHEHRAAIMAMADTDEGCIRADVIARLGVSDDIAYRMLARLRDDGEVLPTHVGGGVRWTTKDRMPDLCARLSRAVREKRMAADRACHARRRAATAATRRGDDHSRDVSNVTQVVISAAQAPRAVVRGPVSVFSLGAQCLA